eukprot:TRINITY_DN11991_c0_g1_i1.p1 TRINITY_DN11991_c0_g1~~TRINITY_DN11991_c0_g1_i1.p1  ORF type:complete len:328 (+),score=14.93 TRINITY_DN11991_c0_g1_i1:185-1168(+)
MQLCMNAFSSVWIILLFGSLIKCSISADVARDVLRARANAWKSCLANASDAPRTKSMYGALCLLQTRQPSSSITTHGFLHIHVYKNAGTVLNVMTARACEAVGGNFTMLRRRRLILSTVRHHPQLTLFTAQRHPIDRFYSIVAESARRGTLPAKFSANARLFKDPVKSINASIHGVMRRVAARKEVHFSLATQFIRMGTQSNRPSPWPLTYVIDMKHPAELRTLWTILTNGSGAPFPELHGRHHQDHAYELCLNATSHSECKHATDQSREVLPWVLMESWQSDASMNASLIGPNWYQDDWRCYQRATEAAKAATGFSMAAVEASHWL